MEDKTVFETLNDINVNGHTEGRNGLTYLSWVWAVSEVMKKYPDMDYEVVKFDGIPYVYDEKTGYMVYTKVTINGVIHEMWLPVMDSNNKAMKAEPYTYTTKNGEKTVEAATMFDINKTIMRCLCKNLAMFGLGLYIYAGEDLPEAEKEEVKKTSEKEAVDELKVLYDKAGGKNFDKWIEDCGGLNPANFPLMKTKLLKQINDKAEKGEKK
jgi:hypothetical protein